MELATVTCFRTEVTSIAYIFVAESGIYTVLAGDRRAILYIVALMGSNYGAIEPLKIS